MAILAHSTFQLLYDHVANGSIHVAFQLFRRNRIHNFNVVFFFRHRCKESVITALEAPMGSLATLICMSAGSRIRRDLLDSAGMNATSMLKPDFRLHFFHILPIDAVKPHETGLQRPCFK
ncbi:hypothetical protein [Pseudomonas brassicacearum]|uniref:hypothetical protein n=1 Tax=Pseudomonas brassicacearum TaxID=930166 RepID=UPI003D6ACD46